MWQYLGLALYYHFYIEHFSHIGSTTYPHTKECSISLDCSLSTSIHNFKRKTSTTTISSVSFVSQPVGGVCRCQYVGTHILGHLKSIYLFDHLFPVKENQAQNDEGWKVKTLKGTVTIEISNEKGYCKVVHNNCIHHSILPLDSSNAVNSCNTNVTKTWNMSQTDLWQ